MKKNIKRRLIATSLLVLIFLSAFLYYKKIVYPFVGELAEETTKAKAISAFNSTNDRLQGLDIFYRDFFEYKYNSDGEIILIKSNASLINQISMIAQNDAQKSMGAMVGEKIALPVGAFTGSTLLSYMGFSIKIEILSISNCTASFTSEFYSVGLNHTIHRLLINVVADISVLVPYREMAVEVQYPIVVAENVIVGRLPDTYLNGDEETRNYLDLLP